MLTGEYCGEEAGEHQRSRYASSSHAVSPSLDHARRVCGRLHRSREKYRQALLPCDSDGVARDADYFVEARQERPVRGYFVLGCDGCKVRAECTAECAEWCEESESGAEERCQFLFFLPR